MTRSLLPVVEWRGDKLILRVRVQARASRNRVHLVDNNLLQVKTTVAPADGAANRKVSRLLASYLSVPPTQVTLLRGHTHRDKQFAVGGHPTIPAELSSLINT